MRPNLLETFKLELREISMTAERLQGMRLPDLPAFQAVKVAIDLIRALDGFDPLIQKVLDHLGEDQMEFALAVKEDKKFPCHTLTRE